MPRQKNRCQWCVTGNDAYIAYHDEEWGVPAWDDQTHFEFLILEAAQAGLSWATVINKRDGYRRAFVDFDAEKVARFTEKRIQKLMVDASIIRNQAKIRAAVNNAQLFLDIQEEFGSFTDYIWDFVDGTPIQNRWTSMSQIPATSKESDALSKDLKKRGFKFVGSTIIYAHMQGTGLVNDHETSCFRYKPIVALGKQGPKKKTRKTSKKK